MYAYKNPCSTRSIILAIPLCLLVIYSADAPALAEPPIVLAHKVEPALLDQLVAENEADFIVWLKGKADLVPARQLSTQPEKGHFVFERLRGTAEHSQQGLRALLDRQDVDYRPFYIVNAILVHGGEQPLLTSLALRSDVARITADHQFKMEEPAIESGAPDQATESNLSFINADDAWTLGITGQEVVLAGLDTGMDWTHPALAPHYRGCLNPPTCSARNHNYNWWDATGTYPTVPGDGHGHGTHVSGVIVGGDGIANQTGVAPGAQTVHCKMMDDEGGGRLSWTLECFEWSLAPWDLNGQNPRPDLAPDAVNLSWGEAGGFTAYESAINALQAAGILVEASAGNSGPSCGTLNSPGDYAQVLSTGSVNHAGGSLPGTLSGFSSRGPSALVPAAYIPDVMAPGVNVRSSIPGSGYGPGSGTSQAGAHVTGLVGLLWAANPTLRGRVTDTVQIILDTAVPLTGQGGSGCGGDYTSGPNNDWGYGTIDALAAVEAAQLSGNPGMLAGTVTDAISSSPITDAVIAASINPTLTWHTATDSLGKYAISVFSGTYSVTVSRYGYMPQTLTEVTVTHANTTTLNVALTPAPSYIISGTITDARTGWPLYAYINVVGYPGDPVWTDPVTGHYSVTLRGGTAYTFDVHAWVAGYVSASRAIGPLVGNQVEDFDLTADTDLCTAPGYVPDGGGCAPLAGGLVVGHVSDVNTGAELNGATIGNDSGASALTQATPDDPEVDDGFYTLFSPAGGRVFTGTMQGYGPEAVNVTVVQSDTVRQDLSLPAGRLAYTPAELTVLVNLGISRTWPLTLTNDGSYTLSFAIEEEVHTEPWVAIPPLPLAVGFANGAYVDGKFYVIGGQSAGSARLGRVQVYDPAANSWDDSLPTMPTPACYVCAGVIGQDIYVAGGLGGPTGNLDTLQVFHTASGTWETVSSDPLPDQRIAPACAVYEDKLYLVGGATITSSTTTYTNTWIYNPAAAAGARWSNAAPAPVPGAFGAALAMNDAIFWLRGSSATQDSAEVYAYSPATDQWTRYPDLQTARTAAAMWTMGDLLMVGGGSWWNNWTSVERYDTRLGTAGVWTYTDSLNEGRYYPAWASAPQEGRLFVAGGWGGGPSGSYLASAEQLDFPPSFPDALWLGETPLSGTLNTGADRTVAVTFDASISEIEQSTTYYAQLIIDDDAPYGISTIPVTMTVLPALAAPGALTTTVMSLTQVDLSWTDNSDNESGFKVERSPNGTSNWVQIAAVGTDVTTYSDTDFPGSTCYYRVRAYNIGGDSVPSNVTSAAVRLIFLPFVLRNY